MIARHNLGGLLIRKSWLNYRILQDIRGRKVSSEKLNWSKYPCFCPANLCMHCRVQSMLGEIYLATVAEDRNETLYMNCSLQTTH